MRTLGNAIERDRVHHAYLFVGSRGTGKTSMAKILAASLNCVARSDARALRRLRLLPLDRGCDVPRRDRDGRRVQQLGRRHPRPAREGGLRAGLRPPQGLHPRRGAHALHGGVERVPQDARGAAAAHDLRAGHHGGGQGAAHGGRPLPPLRLLPPDAAADRRRAAAGGRRGGDRDPRRGVRADRPQRDGLVPRRPWHARAARGLLGRGDRARRRARRARGRRRGPRCSARWTPWRRATRGRRSSRRRASPSPGATWGASSATSRATCAG